MKRRIILLGYTQDLVNVFMCGIYKELKESGHDVVKVYQVGGEPGRDEVPLDWTYFDFSFIEKFKPERIVIFNGFAKESSGATAYLRAHYKTFFCERGWLPQIDNIYIDGMGLGARSSLALTDLSHTKAAPRKVQSTIEELYETHYKTDGHPELGEYVLLPLQLDHDTSITLDSPYFKTMSSLMFFVGKIFPNERIIVTPHPRNADVAIAPGMEVHPGLKTVNLAKTAKAVIGINSTSMIESLIHYKTIGMLGNSILGPSGVTYGSVHTLQFTHNLLGGWKPDRNKIDNVLFNLLNKQFNRFLVPDLIIKQIIV